MCVSFKASKAHVTLKIAKRGSNFDTNLEEVKGKIAEFILLPTRPLLQVLLQMLVYLPASLPIL